MSRLPSLLLNLATMVLIVLLVKKLTGTVFNVITITELDPVTSVQRELLLVKVSTDEKTRSQVLETVQLFRAKVVDVAQDAVTIEATGNTEKISALLRVLEPYGILELIQSGLVAMSRGLKPGSISEDKR